jgi:hypothetical protein
MDSVQNRRRVANSDWPSSEGFSEERFSLPMSEPIPSIGSGSRELRILEGDVTWRIVYEVEGDALVILDAVPKNSTALDGSTVGAAAR